MQPTTSPRALLLVLPLLLALCPGAEARPQAQQPQYASARHVYREIAKEKDDAHYLLFDQLAKYGDEESFKLMTKAVGMVKKPFQLDRAYTAFRHYIGKGALDAEAFDFVSQQVFKARRDEAQTAALKALGHFGNRSLPVFERALDTHKEEAVRRLAADYLVPYLGKKGDRLSVLAILQYANLRQRPMRYIGISPAETTDLNQVGQREVVARALAKCTGEDVDSALIEKLGDPSSTTGWKLLMIELLTPRKGEAVHASLIKALRETDPTVVAEAVKALAQQGDDEEVIALFERLLKSDSEAVRRAAVMGLGKLRLLDPAWWELLLSLSEEADVGLRMGSIPALADLRTPEARARLHALAAAPEWSIRAEAVRYLTGLRDKDTIPFLIDRLEKENGRLREDVAHSLRMLTGLDLGRKAVRWEHWWDQEGAAFTVPTRDVAQAAEQERVAREASNKTSTSFYGVPIFSERVCFVVDRSGSMSAKTRYQTGGTSTGQGEESTRMEVAKRELSRIVSGLPAGRLFNIIFFDTGLEPWQDELVELDDRFRKKALEFISKQGPTGGTAIYDGLWLAFEDPLVDTIYVLTDGQPSAGKVTDIYEIRREVARWNATRNVKIHGVSVGQESQLLRWLAEDSGGRYTRAD